MKLPKLSEFLDIKNPKDQIGTPMNLEIDKGVPGPKEVYLSWEHLASVQDKKGMSKKYIRSFTIIGIFVGLLLLIMQEFFVILIIGSIVFFTQAILKMNPEHVKYEISNHGILIGESMYYWGKLVRFFFINRDGQEVIAIDTTLGFPGRVFVPFDAKDKEKIKEILLKYLYFLEAEPKTFFDNAYDRVMKKFSFEEENAEEEKKELGVKMSKEEIKEDTKE